MHDIMVFYRKGETILILISSKRYFSYPKKSMRNFSLPLLYGSIVMLSPVPKITMPP